MLHVDVKSFVVILGLYSSILLRPFNAQPIDGEWADWGAWEACSITCGGGTQVQTRTCTNPAPSGGGASCTGETNRTQTCNTSPCPDCRELPTITDTVIDVILSADAQQIILVVTCTGNAVFDDGLDHMTITCMNNTWNPAPRTVECAVPTTTASNLVTIGIDTSEIPTSSMQMTTTIKSNTGPRKPPANGTWPDPCISNPCCNNATCVSYRGAYQCQCLPNTAGVRCDIFVIGTCDPESCGIGSSGCYVRPDGTTFCECVPGFDGPTCENNIDECASSPCLNNGTCHDAVNEFQCTCRRGWVGPECMYDQDECLSNPCRMNGTCYEPGAGIYNCYCVPGFTGNSCEFNVDDCGSTKCQNGGHCDDGVQSHHCECPSEFSGGLCEIKSKTQLTLEQAALGTAIIAFIIIGATYGFAAFLDLSKLCYRHELARLKQKSLEKQAKTSSKRRESKYEVKGESEDEDKEEIELKEEKQVESKVENKLEYKHGDNDGNRSEDCGQVPTQASNEDCIHGAAERSNEDCVQRPAASRYQDYVQGPAETSNQGCDIEMTEMSHKDSDPLCIVYMP